jgi:NAD-dependent dihydropyrimidine dehydrogenase PreA subunit
MSKTWYPVIDYEKCIECGACNKKCKHGVYDKEKAPTPVVIYPEGCIQNCHGCGNLCPSEAISYVGDNKTNKKLCSCECNEDGGDCCG